MDREEAEYKIRQYCHLWTLYAENSVELKRKSELSQESIVAACKVYVHYISDILRKLDEVIKIFTIEKELRLIKNRGTFQYHKSHHKTIKSKHLGTRTKY